MNTLQRISNIVPASVSEAKLERDLALERLIFFSDAFFAIAIKLYRSALQGDMDVSVEEVLLLILPIDGV